MLIDAVRSYRFCAVQSYCVAFVPLAGIRLQLQRSAETVDGFVVVGYRELEEGPGLLSINLWVENSGGTSGMLKLQS